MRRFRQTRQTPGMPSPAVVAIVLAAGEGRRFGGPGHKLDAEIDGRSLLRRALDAAVASRVGQVLLVVGDDLPRPVRTGVPDDVVTVVNSALARRVGHVAAGRTHQGRRARRRSSRDRPRRSAVHHRRGVARRGRRRRRHRRGDVCRQARSPRAVASGRLAPAADAGRRGSQSGDASSTRSRS